MPTVTYADFHENETNAIAELENTPSAVGSARLMKNKVLQDKCEWSGGTVPERNRKDGEERGATVR
jgi:hypothetical protein